MHVEVGDRLVLHGQHGTRIGVVVDGDGAGSRIRWADGGESVLSTRSEAPEETGHATWQAAKASPAVSWRRGVTAGVGREASLRQEKLAREAMAEAKKAEPAAEAVAEPPAEAVAEPPAEAPTQRGGAVLAKMPEVPEAPETPEVSGETHEHKPAAGE